VLDNVKRVASYVRMFGLRGLGMAALTGLRSKPTDLTIRVPDARHPVHVRLKTSDIPTYREVFFDSDYAFDLAEEPRVILDAGANIGLASIYFTNRWPAARIIAIEPEESNFRLLTQNVRPYANITPLQAALWENNQMVDLVDPGRGAWSFQTRAPGEHDAPLVSQVQGVTVDRIMRDHGLDSIDLFKVDIEGAEKEVFQSSAQWIDRVGSIVIELHERHKVGCVRSFYEATADFEVRAQRGENVFLARGKSAIPT
jgi:FkbM family methyltransferase